MWTFLFRESQRPPGNLLRDEPDLEHRVPPNCLINITVSKGSFKGHGSTDVWTPVLPPKGIGQLIFHPNEQ